MKPEAIDEGRRWLLQAKQIPSEAFERRDADRAIEIAGEVIKVIEGKL